MGFLEDEFKPLYLILILFAAAFAAFYIFSPSKEVFIETRLLEFEYKGTVTKKYQDSTNHNSFTVEIENEKITIFPYEFYQKVQKLDSISKDKNSIYLKHYRNGKLLKSYDLLESMGLNIN